MFGRMVDTMRNFFGHRRLHHAGAGRSGRDEHHADRRPRADAEIGVRKALGATTGAILRQFFLEGFIMTAVSGLLGMMVALALCTAVNRLVHMPERFTGMILSPSAAAMTVCAPGARRDRDCFAPGAARGGTAAGRSPALRDVGNCDDHCRISSPASAEHSVRPPAADSFTLLVEVVREALYGLSRNRFRASLSMLGISWGIVSVVMLLAYGNGFTGCARPRFRECVRQRRLHRVARPDQHAGRRRAGRPPRAADRG